MMGNVVIVGGGQAGMETALKLRAFGYAGDIHIVGDERHTAYERPPLSKQFLTDSDVAPSWVGTDADKQSIAITTSQKVTAINRSEKSVTLENGSRLPYSHLVLATGGSCRHLPLNNGIKLHDMRTIEDAHNLREKLQASKHVTVIGAGVIGLEVAASARALGVNVSIIEMGPRVMGRNLPENFAPYIHTVHTENNVHFFMSDSIQEITHATHQYQVTLSSGALLHTDCIVSGIGIVPNIQLAESAALEIKNGILVSADMRTSDPSIFAVGDIATLYNEKLGIYERSESWDNANRTAEIAAAAICNQPKPNQVAPWFWSDQYDQNLQVVGWPTHGDHTIFRKTDKSILGIYMLGDEIIGAVGLNAGADISVIRRMMNTGVSPSLPELENSDIKLRSLLRAQRS